MVAVSDLPAILNDYNFRQTVNCSSRDGYDVIGQVFHYTAGGDGRKTADWLCNDTTANRSAHFLGFRDGDGVQMCGLDKSAWHAGKSKWQYKGKWKYGCNRFTIGIELANHGYLSRSSSTGEFWYECGGQMFKYRGEPPVRARLTYRNATEDGRDMEFEGWWERYQDRQIDWLKRLMMNLAEAGYPIRPVGHEEIAEPFGFRKRDPGPLFPWGDFERLWAPRTTNTILEAA